MPIIIKCGPNTVADANIFATPRALPLFDRCEPQTGDEAFVWTSGHNSRLSVYGIVSVVDRNGNNARLTLNLIAGETVRPLGNEYWRVRDWRKNKQVPNGPSPTLPERSLMQKIYMNAHDKVALLGAEEVQFLLGYFPSSHEPSIAADIGEILNNLTLSQTTKVALIESRLGQGNFRNEVLERWHHRCAVSQCGQLEALRASHIKPWRDSTDEERLDPSNGLPLLATLDALFDKGLVSFADDGQMIVSPQVPATELARLGIPINLRRPPDFAEARYLAHHRERIFRRA